MPNYNSVTSIIVDKLYPVIEKSLEKNTQKLKNAIADFVNKNSNRLYDVAPYDIIYYTEEDKRNLFKALDLTEDQVNEIMEECYFWNIPYNPPAAKDPSILVLMMCIRYFLLKKKMKEAEITTIYLVFNGKIYASLYAGVIFPKAPPSKYRTVMDYVVNNMLNDKFDLRLYKNVFGAVRNLCLTWLNAYGKKLTGHPNDDDVGKMVQQIRDRTRSFLYNISSLYYEAYENKNYLNYETDNLSDTDEFRITDNDSLKATRYTQNTVNYLLNNTVSLQIANKCKDQNIKATEVKDIMESILADKSYLDDLYRVINILICDFFKNNPGKSVNSIDFIAHSIKTKPNTKDQYVLELKQIILHWLDESSDNYRRRKSRTATAISYYKAILMYITLAITMANK